MLEGHTGWGVLFDHSGLRIADKGNLQGTILLPSEPVAQYGLASDLEVAREEMQLGWALEAHLRGAGMAPQQSPERRMKSFSSEQRGKVDHTRST